MASRPSITSPLAPSRRGLRALAGALLFAACGESPAPGPGGSTPGPGPTSAAEADSAAVPERATAPPRIGPLLRFEQAVHDFGRVDDTRPMLHSFRFTNAGDERLVIGEIKASCGCTATSLSRLVFEPGESDSIEIEWEPKGHGIQRKSITVPSNSAGAPVTILYIDAEIEPFVSADPPALSFGNVRMGERHARRVKLHSSDPALVVESVSSNNRNFTVEVVPVADGGMELEVVLQPEAPWGQAYTLIQVVVRGRVAPEREPIEHRFTISTNARVFGEVETDPAMFGVGRVDPGGKIRYEVRVRRSSPEPFRILEARVENGTPAGMAVRVEPLPEGQGNGFRMLLEGEAGEHLGNIRGQVRFLTDVPGEEERSLAIMGMVRALEPAEKK